MTVAKALRRGIIAVHRAPLQILSDQGVEFESRLMTDIHELYGIEKIRMSAYKSSTKGVVERFHRTLIFSLKKLRTPLKGTGMNVSYVCCHRIAPQCTQLLVLCRTF